VARNLGILAADGEAVVILDDDSFPEPGFVAAHKKSLQQGVITGGPRAPADPGDERQVWKMRELAKLPPCTPLKFEYIQHSWPTAVITECNICMWRQDFIDMGLFSERLKIYGFVGQEFFARAAYLGYLYQYDPDARILHHRQLDGDNGLSLRRKERQIRVASALRQTLMAPRYSDAQVHWAQAPAAGKPARQPSFWWRAGLAFPYRYARGRAREIRHALVPRRGRKS
jgi:GT2 family glycosyltransferase